MAPGLIAQAITPEATANIVRAKARIAAFLPLSLRSTVRLRQRIEDRFLGCSRALCLRTRRVPVARADIAARVATASGQYRDANTAGAWHHRDLSRAILGACSCATRPTS